MKTRQRFHLTNIVAATFAAGLLSGCSGSFAPGPVEADRVPIGNIQGMVHGGQLPVSGAQIYLYAASTSAYGTSATSLLNSSGGNTFEDGNGNYYVETDANGNFSLGGDYTCTKGTQVYMVAVAGDPERSGGVNDTAMAGLGRCPAVGNLAARVPYLVINTATTVSLAYLMSASANNPFDVPNVATDWTCAGPDCSLQFRDLNNASQSHMAQRPFIPRPDFSLPSKRVDYA